jgi:hypothetical protein
MGMLHTARALARCHRREPTPSGAGHAEVELWVSTIVSMDVGVPTVRCL